MESSQIQLKIELESSAIELKSSAIECASSLVWDAKLT